MIIQGKVYTHVRREENNFMGGGPKICERFNWFSVPEIRSSMGAAVDSYSKLANKIAELGYKNHQFNLLFRGQTRERLDKNGRTKIYPSIYRPLSLRLSTSVRLLRFKSLANAINRLKQYRNDLGVHSILKNHNEWECKSNCVNGFM